MEYMRDTSYICQVGFNLNQLADLCNSNISYVSQVINESLGKSFAQMLTEARIQEAQRRFLDSENFGHLSIEGIIESVGYKSRSTFSKTFKRMTGYSPREFQKKSQTDGNQSEPDIP